MDSTEPSTQGIQIDFEESKNLKSLEYHACGVEMSLEETVAQALITIKEYGTEYDSVPESAFHPHTPLTATDTVYRGSINLMKPQTIEADNDTEVAIDTTSRVFIVTYVE